MPLLFAIVAISGFAIALACAFASSASFVLVTHQSVKFAALWSLSRLLSFLRHLFCHSPIHQLLFHDTTSLIRLVLSRLLPCRLCTLFQATTHTSSYDMSLLVSESLCVVFASCVPTFPRSIGTGSLSALISLMMISNFSGSSSNFLGSVRKRPCDVLWHHFSSPLSSSVLHQSL